MKRGVEEGDGFVGPEVAHLEIPDRPVEHPARDLGCQWRGAHPRALGSVELEQPPSAIRALDLELAGRVMRPGEQGEQGPAPGPRIVLRDASPDAPAHGLVDRHAGDGQQAHARPQAGLLGAEAGPELRDHGLAVLPLCPDVEPARNEPRGTGRVGPEAGVRVVQLVEDALEQRDEVPWARHLRRFGTVALSHAGPVRRLDVEVGVAGVQRGPQEIHVGGHGLGREARLRPPGGAEQQ